MGFPEHTDGHELQEIQEINSLLVGGEQRRPAQSSAPVLSSTPYHLRPNESRPQPFHRGASQRAKLSFADHPDMRVLSSGHPSPTRRASAPQPGFHPVSRQLPYLYSCMYSDCSFGSNDSSDITQHLAVAHQRPDAGSAFDMSTSFNSFAGMSSSRPTTSDSDFSASSAESMFGFPSGSSVSPPPSVSVTDDLRFGFYPDPNLVKMENVAAGVDLAVDWNNPGFFGLDTMAGFDTFGNISQC